MSPSREQTQVTSQEVGNAEQGAASLGGAPRREREPEPENNSVYHLIDGLQKFRKGELLQTLGAIQILNGAVILALGIFLGSLQYASHLYRHFFFFTFYTGYPLWGAVFFIGSGSLSVAAERKNTRVAMQSSFGMNISSAVIALIGIIFLSINLAFNNQSLESCGSSQSPDLCTYMGSSSTGLVSLMLILTLLELCVTISIIVMWCKANCSKSREAISSPLSSVQSGMLPDTNNFESKKIQLPISDESEFHLGTQENMDP